MGKNISFKGENVILVSKCSEDMWHVKKRPGIYFGDYGAK